jgi:hypothetical protein
MGNHRRQFPKIFLVLAVAISFAFAAISAYAAETQNRLASNKLASNKLASNKLASNKLASNALSSTSLEANMATAELLATEDGRLVYSYLISCAIPEGMTIQATVPDVPNTLPDTPYTCLNGVCVFAGSLGLAEDWINHKLSTKGQGWVSACMIARVNLHDTAESISLRGNHPNLTVSLDEAELFAVEEGAFYGNIFTGENEPIDWNACRGEGQASGEFGGLALRDCTEENPDIQGETLCGFNYAGDCADFSPQFPSAYACKSFIASQGIYEDCHDTPGDGRWPMSKTYRQVITVYVTSD